MGPGKVQFRHNSPEPDEAAGANSATPDSSMGTFPSETPLYGPAMSEDDSIMGTEDELLDWDSFATEDDMPIDVNPATTAEDSTETNNATPEDNTPPRGARTAGTDDASSIPAEPSAPDGATPSRLSEERLDYITKKMGNRGRTAIIATTANKADRSNVVTEAMNMKVNELISDHPKITGWIPVIGSVVKVGYAASQRRTARKAISKNGDLDSAFTALKLDPTKSRVINGNEAEERAWQALENAGYDYDNDDIEIHGTRLEQNDQVEKMDETTQDQVRELFNTYYKWVKEEDLSKEELEELDNQFDKKVEYIFERKKNINLDSIKRQKESIGKLANDPSITAEEVKTYLDQHMTLYNASMKEGVNTKQKVDGVINAVDKAGLIGGLVYIAVAREGRTGLRTVVGTAAGAGLTGAAIGGLAGALRGAQRARSKLAEAETRAATTFTEVTPPESAEPGAEPDMGFTAPSSAEADDGAGASPEGSLEGEGEESPESSGRSEAEQKKLFGKILAHINQFKRMLTGEEGYLKKIEELRDRENADDIEEKLSDLCFDLSRLSGSEEEDEARDRLLEKYAETIARGRVSSKKKIDLIKYRDGDRQYLEDTINDAEKLLFKNQTKDEIDQQLKDPESEIGQRIQEYVSRFERNNAEANKLRTRFMIRSAFVDAVTGAAIGAAGGTIFHAVAERGKDIFAGITGNLAKEVFAGTGEADTTAEGLSEIKVENLDGDDQYELTTGDEGSSSALYRNDGSLTDDAQQRLEADGYTINDKIEAVPIAETPEKKIPLDEYFKDGNEDITKITRLSKAESVLKIDEDSITRDGEGNVIIKVGVADEAAPEDIDYALGKYIKNEECNVYIAGISNLTESESSAYTIKLPVDSDGKVTIKAGTPAESLFGDNGNFLGSKIYLGYEEGDGAVLCFHEYGDGVAETGTITIRKDAEPQLIHHYTLTKDGKEYHIQTPDEVTKHIETAAQNGSVPDIGNGQKVYYTYSANNLNVVNENGDIESVRMPEHHGGYNVDYDTYFSQTDKDGDYSSGASIARIMLKNSGEDIEGLSTSEIDSIFSDKIASGKISKGEVLRTYLETMGQSPEAIVTTRVMLGDELEVDGNLVDTEEEINQFADTLSRASDEEYDQFVNDTYARFYEKAADGNMRLIDYTKEPYQYTTWSKPSYSDVDYNGVWNHLGEKTTPTTGLGLVFEDASGNSIYDKDVVRKLWNLPDDYNLSYVADRLNCIQKTASDFVESPAPTVEDVEEAAAAPVIEETATNSADSQAEGAPAPQQNYRKTPWSANTIARPDDSSESPNLSDSSDSSDSNPSNPGSSGSNSSNPESDTEPKDSSGSSDSPGSSDQSDSSDSSDSSGSSGSSDSPGSSDQSDQSDSSDSSDSNPSTSESDEPKDNENATRIDDQSLEDNARDIESEKDNINPTTTQEVEEEQQVTERPASDSYEGTNATIKANNAASGGSDNLNGAASGESSGSPSDNPSGNASSASSDSSSSSSNDSNNSSGSSGSSSNSNSSSNPSSDSNSSSTPSSDSSSSSGSGGATSATPSPVTTPNNDYSSNNGGANSGRYAPVADNTSSQAATNVARIPISGASFGWSNINDDEKAA